ncbi:hypothetical protein [Streptomyces flaveus]|uniref:hypothetical protein n=1 Tax=Streptomyces flaveus TaxID=66370 RepID=UPI00331EEB8A
MSLAVRAAGRDQLNIKDLGHTRVIQLGETGLVAGLAELFTLTRDQLLGLERMGATSTEVGYLSQAGQQAGEVTGRNRCGVSELAQRARDGRG